MRKILAKIIHWWREMDKTDIMVVHYDLYTNKLASTDWIGQKIPYFSGDLTPELLAQMKFYCRLNTKPQTVIYIWAGHERKHLAYHEPIDNYLKDIELFKTGQGFDYDSGIRYGETVALKCPTCKRKYDTVIAGYG